MLRIVFLFLLFSSCVPAKRAQWYLRRAVALDNSIIEKKSDTIFKYRDTTIYIDKFITIEGTDTVIVVKDSVRTERTLVYLKGNCDSCYAFLQELPFQYRFKDSIRFLDTCVQTVNTENIEITEAETNWKWVVWAGIIGFLLGIIIGIRK